MADEMSPSWRNTLRSWQTLWNAFTNRAHPCSDFSSWQRSSNCCNPTDKRRRCPHSFVALLVPVAVEVVSRGWSRRSSFRHWNPNIPHRWWHSRRRIQSENASNHFVGFQSQSGKCRTSSMLTTDRLPDGPYSFSIHRR
jgi:hypothetical protein